MDAARGPGSIPSRLIATRGPAEDAPRRIQRLRYVGRSDRGHDDHIDVIAAPAGLRLRGHVSKQGSRMLRWALAEAIQRQPAQTKPQQVKDAIIARRGAQPRGIAKTAAARILLTQVFYGLRDGTPAAPPVRQRELPARTGVRPRSLVFPAAADTSRPGGGNGNVIGPARPWTRTAPCPPARQAGSYPKG
jgi:hypothetical protein